VILRWIFAALLLLALVAGIGVHHGLSLLEPVVASDDATTVIFEVERGRGMGQVARNLAQAGLIRDARAMILLARVRGDLDALKAGEYEVSAGWATETILERLISGRVVTFEVVLPEGIKLSEIAQRLEDAGLIDSEAFIAAAQNEDFVRSLGIEGANLEGYLYPETYRLPRKLSGEAIAKILVAQFDRVWAELEPFLREQALSKREIVTLASIVEKETAAVEERPLIASVFHNRLQQGMRLETDPTVIYGIPDFDGNLKKKHLQDRSNAYNTYRIRGLPPGPIANPGIDALRAALQPAETDYLYFVSKNDGRHHFSRSYREHVNAVNQYQLRRRRR
jgi:UPF0755 protein